jgi:hypothetical protein
MLQREGNFALAQFSKTGRIPSNEKYAHTNICGYPSLLHTPEGIFMPWQWKEEQQTYSNIAIAKFTNM